MICRRPDEVSLAGGVTNKVVRVGDTVRRPSNASSPLMRDVLRQLERAGFDAAPRWLGVDEQGRDVLSWIDGDTHTDRGRMHPYVGDPPTRVTFSTEQVAAALRLLAASMTLSGMRSSATVTSGRGISSGATACRSA